MLSHSKTEMEIIKQLASNDKGYRSLTLSWFKNSPLFEIIKKGYEYGFKLVVTTDHGTINVKNPSKIIGNNITQATLVPRHLVVSGKVAILDNDSKLHYVDIDIVRQQGSHVIVANGLANGDRLITSALDYPVDGMKLALASDETQLEEKDAEAESSETQMANNKESGE